MLKILHFADAHIDIAAHGRRDPETGLPFRVLDFLKSLDTIIDTAIAERVDLVLFAGDAYKDRSPAPTFQREFAFRIQDLAKQCPVVMLVGNHDLASIERRASSIEIYETLSVPNTILGREYRVQPVETTTWWSTFTALQPKRAASWGQTSMRSGTYCSMTRRPYSSNAAG